MRVLTFALLFLSVFLKCFAVPPSPTDRLWEELISAKSVMTNIATQLEKFNSLYLMKLEQRMTTMASTLSSIDSNVKNLQERAHVWDTFQLHVSAWNEQINTLDKKVEIISKGQEKMFILDGKMNSISNIDYKTERIIGKLDDNLATLQTMIKIVENQNHDPLLGEFTTRGVLSTLKTIERKLDKLQMQHSSGQSMLSRQINDNKRSSENPDGQQRGKLLIKCNTPPIVEELLSDVASKVDVMFDKFSGTEEQSDESSNHEEQENTDVSQESKTDPDLKLIKGLLKRLNQPCKRTIKVLENLETSIKAIDNTTITILEDGQTVQNNLLGFYQSSEKKIEIISSRTESLLQKVEDFLDLVQKKVTVDQESLGSYFLEQRGHFAHILQEELQTSCLQPKEPKFPSPGFSDRSSGAEDRESLGPEDRDETVPYYDEPPKLSDKFNCEDLDSNETSGVYILGRTEYRNPAGRNYNVRYCEVRDGNVWTVIQRRGENPEVQKFNFSWVDYKNGFGSLSKDFWMGNDFIYNLCEEKQLILRVELEDFVGNRAWAEYNTFSVDSEEENYKLQIGGYRGNASDSFSAHNNSSFSTFDRTNDEAPECCPCSPSYGGGWWFYSCFEANLNGVYYRDPHSNDYFRGLIWEHWLGNYSLKKTKMMVRPKTNSENESGSGTEPDIVDDPFVIPEDP